jgi:hypothetical protein
MIVQNNNIPQIQQLFPTTTNAGGNLDANGVTPTDSKGKKEAVRNGRATLAKAKQSTPQIKQTQAKIQGFKAPLNQANGYNFNELTNFQLAQTDAIQGFKKTLDGGSTSPSEFKLDSSVPTFNLAAAQGALKTSAFDFTTDTLTPANLHAKGSTEIANSEGNNALSSLGEAMGSFDGGLGSIGSGGVQIATGIGMLSTSGFTFGLSAIPAIAMIAKGGVDVAQGFGEVTQGEGKSLEAENTGENATQNYELAAQKLGETGANLDQLEEFYKSINAQAFPVLNQAQRGNDNLFTLGASLGANVQAPATSAPANVADASWATPTSPLPTGDTAQAGGSTAPTALGVQAPLAGGNTAPEPPQAGGLTDAEVAFMKAFKENPGVVNAANGQLQGALRSAPTGFNTEGLASQTVTDASQSQPLQELYARLEAKKNQAEGQQAQPSQGLGTAFAGNGVNQQDPTAVAQAQAPNDGQAQAPQATEGGQATPATPPTLPTRAGLTIPQAPPVAMAPKLTIPQFAPQPAVA